MQVVILAAGRGTRISHVTDGLPKCFLKVGGERLIERHVNILKSLGVRDIIIVVGYKKERLFELFNQDPMVRFAINHAYQETNTLASLWHGMDALTEDFLFIHADTIYDKDILRRLINAPGEVILPIDEHRCFDEEMKVVVEDGCIIEISKAIDRERAHGESIGIALIKKHVIPLVKKYANQFMRNAAYQSCFESVLQKIIDEGNCKIKPLYITGHKWEEIDFEKDYLRAKILFEQQTAER